MLPIFPLSTDWISELLICKWNWVERKISQAALSKISYTQIYAQTCLSLSQTVLFTKFHSAWSIGQKSSRFVSSLHRTESQNFCGLDDFLANWSQLFLCFWVSSGVLAWKLHVFSTHLTMQAETSVHVATKSWCRSFAVTQEFFWTCLLSNLVAGIDSFLFYPVQELENLLPIIRAFTIFLHRVPCMWRAMISSLNFLRPFFWHISNMQSNVTLTKLIQFGYFMRPSSNTPGATSETELSHNEM